MLQFGRCASVIYSFFLSQAKKGPRNKPKFFRIEPNRKNPRNAIMPHLHIDIHPNSVADTNMADSASQVATANIRRTGVIARKKARRAAETFARMSFEVPPPQGRKEDFNVHPKL
jgi:hypothetical protein